MQFTTTRTAAPTTASDLARRTTFGVVTALVLAFAVRLLVGVLDVNLGVAGPTTPFAAPPILGSTVVAGIGAAVVYAALARFTARPTRNFVAAAAVVFAVMLVPVFAFTPSLGVTAAGQAVLVVLHAVIAAPLVAFVVGAVRV
ncbi:DUF6069 family protein [Halogeometricum sp. CBA1124]|uniref:DUF6069 family protein n=1 Tax=Halogeometricum sp. CBA1124 TaxID=2668071 RepID=UPI00142ADD15|nr:DUF6069 family protein [Halogeometricum sp. CBA1124]MUV58913.1 hypothetical protein [Halogeometricum sp. CBA1124]